MDALKSKRCPHFQIVAERLVMDGPASYLAIRHCLLAERLIMLLRPDSPEGNRLADKMIVRAANGKEYAFVGPDLEAVTQSICTLKRCDEHCTPAYKLQLQRFELHDPQEETVTCDDEDVENATDGSDSDHSDTPNSHPAHFAKI